MPTSGRRAARREHVVEVHHRLAHAHEHRVVDGAGASGGSAAPGRRSPRPSGCGRTSSGRSRRTCRSVGSPTARTGTASGVRRDSASAPASSGRPSAGAEQRLDRPVAGVRLVLDGQRRERDPRPRARCAAAPERRSSTRSRLRPARPTSRSAGPGSRARRVRPSVRSTVEKSMALWWQAMRLAKYLASAGVASRRAAETDNPQRARDGRRRAGHRSGDRCRRHSHRHR